MGKITYLGHAQIRECKERITVESGEWLAVWLFGPGVTVMG